MNRMIRLILVFVAVAAIAFPVAAQQADHQTAPNPLVQLLQSKGILTADEAATIRTASSTGEANERLANLLLSKGLISQDEYNTTVAASAVSASENPAGGARLVSAAATASPATPAPVSKTVATPAGPPRPSATGVWPMDENMVGLDPSDGATADAGTIPAIAPIRVLPIGVPKDPKGIIPDIKLGSGAMITPYGFFKSTAIYDTTNSGGPTFGNNDFPLPLLLQASTSADTSETGPDSGSQFHLKARSSRFGFNFYWPISGPDVTLTGKLEFDFEGDYTVVNNINISSVRNSQPRLRLAWMRMDTKLGGVPWFVEFGQDWTVVGSSTQPDLVETTQAGAFFGSIYERLPQIRTGLQFGAGDFKFQPEFALTLPAFGDANLNTSTTTAVLGSLGTVATGEQNQTREASLLGPDSGQPGVEGRIVLDFPLNKSWSGVPNAELIVSGHHAEGREIVPRLNIPSTAIAGLTTPTTACPTASVADPASLQCYYPNGYDFDIPQNIISVSAQIPTPWVTLIAKAYRGGDMRFFFGGQTESVFADTEGLEALKIPGPTNLVTCTTTGTPVPGVCATGATALTNIAQNVYALNGDPISFINPGATCTTTPVDCVGQIAQLRPVRGYGGFTQLGFPLSRIFGADPNGRNAGWRLFIGYGVDGVLDRDTVRTTGLLRSDYVPFSLRYRINKWAELVHETTWYDTRLGTKPGDTPTPDTNCAGACIVALFRGDTTARVNHDWRIESGTIFTF